MNVAFFIVHNNLSIVVQTLEHAAERGEVVIQQYVPVSVRRNRAPDKTWLK